MSHILSLSNNKAICEKPDMLGLDWIVVDYSGGPVCLDCTRLVVAYNAKIDRYEMSLATVPSVKKEPAKSSFAKQSFYLGLALATVWYISTVIMWIILT